MEQVANINTKQANNWFDRRCRDIVFSVFEKLTYGQLEIVEGGKHHYFPKAIDNSTPVQGKIVVHDQSLYRDFVKGGSIGAAEAFIDGKWSSPDLTAVIRIFAKAQQQTDRLESKKSWFAALKNKLIHWQNRNSQQGSKRNILAHYDLGNELYTRFLDPEMMYSAAIYPNEQASLAQAQIHKLDTICQRLELQPGDTVLEIGTGWGGLAIHMAKNYGCHVTTTTISDAQFQYAEQRVKELGLEQQVTLLKKDYRELQGQYDKVVSIEMIEAVGYEYLPSFFKQCHSRLKEGGKLLIQSITIADQRFEYYKNNVDFIQRYIFPGGFLPSVFELSKHIKEHTSLVVEELHDIGLHYAKTLADWRDAFNKSWPELTELGYDEQFKRLWLFYLGYCEGGFLERATSTVHLVARKQ
ncbi:SAM-dependent methyltransferase [Thalassotalea marina]|uniref:Cyclopropane-fatty-acyl-phospholipid synthase n=1 Tax=Thalassotalea marina TaxID=1673741 RepID=A0A919EPC4_9GAMM|nr:cyclopropane-fatty-acyl-phospholipid synthase [Thalassotalea marina]